MSQATTQYRDDWRKVIYDATGDFVKTQRAMELAELNGLFDPVDAIDDQRATTGGFDELWFNRRDYFEQEACDVEMDALRKAGWNYTSQTPCSVWMWQKDISGKLYSLSQCDAARIQEKFDRMAYFAKHPDELNE